MNFLHVDVLLSLLLLPCMLGLHIHSQRQKKRKLHQFAHAPLWQHLVALPAVFNRRVKPALLLCGMALAILALAQPRWGFRWQEVQVRGVDIILALDVSKSMLAEDVRPNRLTRAKHEIIDLLQQVQGDRVGLVAFAGTSFLQSPLTADYQAIELFLDALDTELIPKQGTAMGHALQTAIQAFSQTPPDARAVILLTDGENHGGDLEAVAQAALEAGVKLFVMGIGQPAGAPLPAPQGGFLKNQQGELILSKLNELALQKLALATGGSYVRSIAGDLDLEKIYFQDIKNRTTSEDLQTSRHRLWNEQFQWFLLAAILCWMLEPLLSNRALKQNPPSPNPRKPS